MTSPQNNIYHVHVYREMRLYFPGIAASSCEAAALVAAEKRTDEAQTIEDCDGANIAALVDIDGDADYGQSRIFDFEAACLLASAPQSLDALLDIKRLAEKCGDHEADPFALLDLIADKARAAINKATKP